MEGNPSGTQMLHTECAGGVEVGLYTIQGGGHSPGPGTVAWNFLKTKSLPLKGRLRGRATPPLLDKIAAVAVE